MSAEERALWQFLLGVRGVLRKVGAGQGGGEGGEMAEWVEAGSDEVGARGARAVDGTSGRREDSSDGAAAMEDVGNEVSGEVFMAFISVGLGMCAEEVRKFGGGGGGGEGRSEEEEAVQRGLRTLFWVANAFELAGDGIRKVRAIF